jgi:hypothetical protein
MAIERKLRFIIGAGGIEYIVTDDGKQVVRDIWETTDIATVADWVAWLCCEYERNGRHYLSEFSITVTSKDTNLLRISGAIEAVIGNWFDSYPVETKSEFLIRE